MASKRSQAGWLAQALTEQTGVAVTVAWEGQGVGRGDWWVRWSDGPTVETLQVMARTQAAYLRPLDVAALRWGRAYTPRAWALALIAQAGRYPEITDWHELLGEAETWLDDTTLPEYPLDVDGTHRADELVADFDGHEAAMAQAVLASADPRERRPAPPVAVTKRGDATGCEVCARAVARAGTGRPARYCSPACRTTAWRRRTTQAVTERGDETECEVCARAVARAGTGRPARYCSPACRTTAWRRRTTQAVTERGDEILGEAMPAAAPPSRDGTR